MNGQWSLLVVLVLAQVASPAGDGPGSEIVPPFDSAFVLLQRSVEAHANAVRTLAGTPTPSAAIAAHFTLEAKGDAIRAAGALLTSSPGELATGIRLLREHVHDFNDDGTSLRADLIKLVADLRRRVSALPVHEGADAALELLWLEQGLNMGDDAGNSRRQATFAETYAGTGPYLDYIVSQVESSRGYRDVEASLQRYRELSIEHAGTDAGARALYLMGFRLGACCSWRDADPTDRFLRVIDVVNELESGRYPAGDWVSRAPSLVGEFFISDPKYAPANVPRAYAAYKEFVKAHLDLRAAHPSDDAINWIIRTGIGRLPADRRDSEKMVMRFLDDLRTEGVDADLVEYQRARFYLGYSDEESYPPLPIDRSHAERRAREAFQGLLGSGRPETRARALFNLAAMDFYGGRYREARAQYEAFVQEYPRSSVTWIAALRAAQAREAVGDVRGAATEYEELAGRFTDVPVAAVLARVSAGAAYENASQFPAAGQNYQQAVEAWTALPSRFMVFTKLKDGVRPISSQERFTNLTRSDLMARASRLAAAVGPEGALLYEGRRAIETGAPRNAFRPLEKLIKEYPRSASAVEAAALFRRARFDAALADASGERAARARSERELAALTTGPYDSVVSLSKLALAAMRARSGPSAAVAPTRAALEEWHLRQSASPAPTTGLERDVAEIRRAVFLPRGGGVYGATGWNAFEWPSALPPLITTNREVTVKTADGKQTTIDVAFTPSEGRVLFLSADDLRGLTAILDRIGGTATREPRSIMETPHQPTGASVDIADVWGKFFHVRPGHWGGWELTTYPDLSTIEFDATGTHALANVAIGYSGCTVVLDKENGRWVAKRLTAIWIT